MVGQKTSCENCPPTPDTSLERHQQFRVIDPEGEIRLFGTRALQQDKKRLVENELARVLRSEEHYHTCLRFQDHATFVEAKSDVLQRQNGWNPLELAKRGDRFTAKLVVRLL